MREIDTAEVREALRNACGKIAVDYSPDILKALKCSEAMETEERSKTAMDMLLENAETAHREQIPICQDTGMAVVWLTIGQDVHFTGGSLKKAVNEGIAEGYTQNYLRASIVRDPLFERTNTKDNTPAVIYMDIVDGDQVKIELMAKGFGSENMSASKMLKPAEGIEGVKHFVLDTIRNAGPNACPPMIVGVGIGGSFDYSAFLSKKALMRPLDQYNENPSYARLEKELLEEANNLGIGPMGFGGRATALKISVLQAPTHIAGLPVSVNICCHACRHEEIIL